MMKFYWQYPIAASIIFFCGCAKEPTPESITGPMSIEAASKSLTVNAIGGEKSYQESMERIRHALNDKELYQFVAAISLIRNGTNSYEEFIQQVNGKTAQEIIANAKMNGFIYMNNSFRRRMTAEVIRNSVMSRIGDIPETDPRTLLVIDTTDRISRDNSMAAMVMSANDDELYDLTTALDVILAMSIDEADYNNIISGLTMPEIIEKGKANMFDAATRKIAFLAPASLLRGQLDFPSDTTYTPRLKMDSPQSQLISMGDVLASLSDDQTYMFMAAVEILRNECQDEKEFNEAINNKTASQIVHDIYRSEPGSFTSTVGILRTNYPPERLKEIKAQYIAHGAIAKKDAANNAAAQPVGQK